MSEEEVKEEKKDNSGMMTGVMAVALVLGLGLALLLFKVLPETITGADKRVYLISP